MYVYTRARAGEMRYLELGCMLPNTRLNCRGDKRGDVGAPLASCACTPLSTPTSGSRAADACALARSVHARAADETGSSKGGCAAWSGGGTYVPCLGYAAGGQNVFSYCSRRSECVLLL